VPCRCHRVSTGRDGIREQTIDGAGHGRHHPLALGPRGRGRGERGRPRRQLRARRARCAGPRARPAATGAGSAIGSHDVGARSPPTSGARTGAATSRHVVPGAARGPGLRPGALGVRRPPVRRRAHDAAESGCGDAESDPSVASSEVNSPSWSAR